MKPRKNKMKNPEFTKLILPKAKRICSTLKSGRIQKSGCPTYY